MSDTDLQSGAGYETSDANARTLVAWVLGLVVVLTVAVITAWIFFEVLARHAARTDPKVSPLAVTESKVRPEPRLLEREHDDLTSVRREEDQVLHGYDWVDKAHGVVRIPIDRAMELIAKEGLPSRPARKGAR
jgi:hypothetical protein